MTASAAPDVLSSLPFRVDRKTGAELVTRYYFPIAARTLEVWPLTWRLINGKAACETADSAGSGEDAAALAQVRAFLEAHGESRFTLLSSGSPGGEQTASDVARTVNRAGFRRRVGVDGDRWEYLILPETWKAEVCKGLDAKRTADLLAARKLLTGGTERHRAASVNILGEGKRRVYILSGDILGDDDAQ
jgi:uncharacterized protein (DUF927 family)